jgi:hypothetical protein
LAAYNPDRRRHLQGWGRTAWSSVPGRVAGIAHEHIGTTIGLMLTLAAVGGFLVPLASGDLVPSIRFTGGWIFLAVVTAVFASSHSPDGGKRSKRRRLSGPLTPSPPKPSRLPRDIAAIPVSSVAFPAGW